MGSVFLAFLVIGLAVPTLPLHVHDGLRLGGLAIGIVVGAQFAASFVSRVWVGDFADGRGAKRAVLLGLAATVAAGLIYLLSLSFKDHPALSASILVSGRAVRGAAESFVITGAGSWGLALGGPRNTGKVIAWIGTAMYAAFAVGARPKRRKVLRVHLRRILRFGRRQARVLLVDHSHRSRDDRTGARRHSDVRNSDHT